MTTLEWILLIGYIFILVEIAIIFLAKACRLVFDLESIEKQLDSNIVEKQKPTFITGVGRINK